MLSLSTSSSKFIRRLARLIEFVGGLVLIYFVALLLMTNIRPGTCSLYQLVTRNYLETGGYGHTLERFRDLENYGDIDLLFIGSSHCYRSFDPRIFASSGLTSFNMGSTSQSPLNTYYLLNEYLNDLKPQLVIYEVYFPIFEGNGLESFYDLLANVPLSTEVVKMGLATRHPHAVNAITARLLSFSNKHLSDIHQKGISGDNYVSGGFVSSKLVLADSSFGEPRFLDIEKMQLSYLKKVIRLVREGGSDIMLVVAPMPDEWLANMMNYGEVSDKIQSIADQMSVPYYDFNRIVKLDTYRHFSDTDHLNASGVEVFNCVLIDTLSSISSFAERLNLDRSRTIAAELGGRSLPVLR
jgi:hypothetical protein